MSLILYSKSQQFNKRFGLYYDKFFFVNKDYFFVFCDNNNFDTRGQLLFLNYFRHIIVFCKVKKKVLSTLFSLNKLNLYLLLNPLVFKIKRDDFAEFVSIYLSIKETFLLRRKKEKRFFDFSIILYEMSSFYLFHSFLNDYDKLKSNLFFKKSYNYIYFLCNVPFLIIFNFFNILYFLYCYKLKDANI